jgi:co-chaperonin GroES (HSP10)
MSSEKQLQKFVPINDRILLRVKHEEKTSGGGIILPVDQVTAEVVAVGPGLPVALPPTPQFVRAPLSVKPGDIVSLPKRYKELSEEVLHEGATHYVATEQVVLGILQG